MNSHLIVVCACAMLLPLGCSVREAEAEKPKRDREAQARAEVARKEMEALPKAFQTPDYFRKNEPEIKALVPPARK
jgi:hypothetical protein